MDGFHERNLLLKLTCCSRPDPLWLGALLILLQISTSIRTFYVQKSLVLINLWKTIKSAFDCLWQKHKRRTIRLRTSRHESEREIWPHWTLLHTHSCCCRCLLLSCEPSTLLSLLLLLNTRWCAHWGGRPSYLLPFAHENFFVIKGLCWMEMWSDVSSFEFWQNVRNGHTQTLQSFNCFRFDTLSVTSVII